MNIKLTISEFPYKSEKNFSIYDLIFSKSDLCLLVKNTDNLDVFDLIESLKKYKNIGINFIL